MENKCKICGCTCALCNNAKHQVIPNFDVHLHEEIENLRQRLIDRENHIVTMETKFFSEADKFPNGELACIKEEIMLLQDKYHRLLESHKRVQKVNQNLEDKLLKIVDKCETEKSAFSKDISTLSHRLADANYTIHRLTQDNENYRNDVNLAMQLLQNRPANFIGQKYETLPPEFQAKIKSYVSQKNLPNESPVPAIKSITVPISTFPPTAMVYNVTKPTLEKQQDISSDDEAKPPMDIVSAAILAKVLEDREKERIFTRHCNSCTCYRTILKIDTECQTDPIEEERQQQFLKENDIDSIIDKGCDIIHAENVDKRNERGSENFLQKYDRKSSKDLKNLKSNESRQSKNWKNSNFSNISCIEAISDRTWIKNNNARVSPTPLPVPEVKKPESPELSNSIASDEGICNNNQTAKPNKSSTSGPRNCLMRVTPGSKNILLDSVDTYETVLYTSGCNKPNTALVHIGKSSTNKPDKCMITIDKESNDNLMSFE